PARWAAWGLLALLPLTASMCQGDADPGPPPCPAQAPAPVRQTGELVRFEYGLTDLEGRPKNCFRQGEDFRLYLYVINQTEGMLHWQTERPMTPIIVNAADADQKPIALSGPQCRLFGHHINALDTLILEMPLSWHQLTGGLPYPSYWAKRYCGGGWYLPPQAQKLAQGRYVAELDMNLPLAEVKDLELPIPGPSSRQAYKAHLLKTNIDFTIQ
ncbi:MAG: hypothetical protein MUC97_17460, partial [Bernardetiaceae bacterium]|nr:hypothetical protein [Bernardetiaceae bacterium]